LQPTHAMVDQQDDKKSNNDNHNGTKAASATSDNGNSTDRSSIKAQYRRSSAATNDAPARAITASSSTSSDNNTPNNNNNYKTVKDQYRKDEKATTTDTAPAPAAAKSKAPNNDTANNSNNPIDQETRTFPATTTLEQQQQQQHASLADRVGAWRVGISRVDDDDSVDSVDSGNDNPPLDEESNHNNFDRTTAMDEEMGNNNNNNNNDLNGPLIQAELVTDDNDNPQSNVMTLDAEILKDADAPEQKRRRQMIRFATLSVIAMIISIVVIVTVIVVSNNNKNSGSGPFTAAPTTSPVTPLPTTLPTTAPTTSPVTALPTDFPTLAPTISPSDTPSQAPTQLTWSVAMGGAGEARLDGIHPQDGEFLQVTGSKAGTRVFVRDVSNVTEFQNAQLLLALQFGGDMDFDLLVGVGSIERDLSVYLCGNTTTEENEDDGTEPFCRPALTAGAGAQYGAMALSENGALLVMDSGPQEGGITLHDLRTATSLDGTGYVPDYANVLSSFNDPLRSVGIAPTKGYFGAVTYSEVVLFELEGWEEPGQVRVVSDSGFLLPPPFQCPPFDPTCVVELPKSIHHMVMSDHSILVGINVGLSQSVPCASRCFGAFNGIEIRVYDLNLGLVGNIIEVGTNYSMIGTQGNIDRPGGLAITSDGKILAVSSANFPRFDLDDGNQPVPYYQVDVYRLNEENNLWEPLGSTLYGAQTNAPDNFGGSLALNSDGTVLVIGASKDNSVGVGNGRVSTYQLMRFEGENGTFVEDWAPFLDDLTGESGSAFGNSVNLVPSGDRLLVGAPLSDANGIDSGEAFLYNLAGFS